MPSPGRTRSLRSRDGQSLDVDADDPVGVCRDPGEARPDRPRRGRCRRGSRSRRGRADRASTASACASELTNPASSRCVACTGSNPTRTPSRRRDAARRARSASTKDLRTLGSPAGRRAGRRGRRRIRARTRRSVVTDASSASIRSPASSGPSIPGIASGSTDGTAGTQTATRRPCSRSRAMFASSSSGSLNSQRPIASNPAAAYAVDVLANVAPTVEISERERITSVRESAAVRAAAAAIGGFVSSFATR